ncbi:MATE family multidrug resistance protein [Bacillus sp. V-88]|uniref:MATE family efflux transporter n=1 Tax=Rossellomorea sp. KS-H15a TaxID=2963940 RepID=UPI0009A79E64|nr:MATE family efflux transporter [Rossellomorea sp. KS-H15a]OXS62188.1 MATE family efflux transporter [Bacillus sp. DSM 27956]PRX77501.1 MATE family multidrug resistance protein [Bacillus sp. V-88]UTE76021.1 MATE family efflux transporter [Rossellomorea sp. KS-H15a]SLK20367.1 multidrug resistance protein, MATE family [Bacillus sp. V-88]
MRETHTMKDKIKQLSIILIPILVTQLGMFAMNFFDTIMSGKYSPIDLAGVAIGSSLWVPVFTGLSGILLAVTPIVAQLNGRGNKKEVPHTVLQGVYAAIALSLIVMVTGGLALNPILNGMNIEPEVRMVAKEYLIALSFGMIPLFIYNVLRSFIDALGMTRVTMFITLMSLPINVVFNYLLIFGKLGLPALGGVGAGVASAITYWLITLIAFWVVHTKGPFSQYTIFRTIHKPDLAKWKEIFVIGVPIGLSIFFEVSIFSAVTLLMSNYDTVVIAAHQAAINFASFLYMIPLSISMALTIVVGFEVGAKRLRDAKVYSWMGVSFALLLAVIYGIILLVFRSEIAYLYSDDAYVLELTAHFLLYAVFFQLSDAIQAPVQGALRGYKDVNITFIMALVSYWVIGLPLGYILANYTTFGPYGYWLGLTSGLTAGAITLSGRLLFIQKKYRKQYSH